MKRRYTRRELLSIFAGAATAASVRAAVLPPATSRVVTARFGGPAPTATADLGRLLDEALTAQTGIRSAAEAWRSLFSPDDIVAIKVNTLGGRPMSTNPALVSAATQRLESCGIKRRHIIIWDRLSRELKEAGFEIKKGGGTVQCFGTDEVGYSGGLYEHGSVASLFSRIFTNRCSKVINMPVLKDHSICGLTFALKNYFGAIHNPNKFHLNRCDPYIADLNAMRTIRNKETLIIGDMTRVQADGGPAHKSTWSVPWGGVLVGRDPVAVDRSALGILEQLRKELGRPTLRQIGRYPDYIDSAAAAGVGTHRGMEHRNIIL